MRYLYCTFALLLLSGLAHAQTTQPAKIDARAVGSTEPYSSRQSPPRDFSRDDVSINEEMSAAGVVVLLEQYARKNKLHVFDLIDADGVPFKVITTSDNARDRKTLRRTVTGYSLSERAVSTLDEGQLSQLAKAQNRSVDDLRADQKRQEERLAKLLSAIESKDSDQYRLHFTVHANGVLTVASVRFATEEDLKPEGGNAATTK